MEICRVDDYQSWLLTIEGQRLLIDPWLVDDLELGPGGRLLRRRHEAPVALRPREVQRSDIVFLSSSAWDHAHRATLASLDRGVRIVGSAAAVRLARRLGFRSTIALGHGTRVVLDGRLALTGIRSRAPFGFGSTGLLAESIADGVRVYHEAHLIPELRLLRRVVPASVDVLIAPVEGVEAGGVRLAMDLEDTLAVARELGVRCVLPTATGPGRCSGLLSRHVLRSDDGLEHYLDAAELYLGPGRARVLAAGEALRMTAGPEASPRRRSA